MVYIWRFIQIPLFLLLFIIVFAAIEEFKSNQSVNPGLILISMFFGLVLCTIEFRIRDIKKPKPDISVFLKSGALEAYRTRTFLFLTAIASYSFFTAGVFMTLDRDYMGITGLILGTLFMIPVFNHIKTRHKSYIKVSGEGIETKLFGLTPWREITWLWLLSYTVKYNMKKHALYVYTDNISEYETRLSYFDKAFFRFVNKDNNLLVIPLNFLNVDANVIYEYSKKSLEQYRLKHGLPALTGDPKFDDILKALHNNTRALKKVDISSPMAAEEIDAIFTQDKQLQSQAIEQVKQQFKQTSIKANERIKKSNRILLISFVLLILALLLQFIIFGNP